MRVIQPYRGTYIDFSALPPELLIKEIRSLRDRYLRITLIRFLLVSREYKPLTIEEFKSQRRSTSDLYTSMGGQSVEVLQLKSLDELIEEEYLRTPGILDAPVDKWESINPKLCYLIFERESIIGKNYAIRQGYYAAKLGTSGGLSTSEVKVSASRSNGKLGGRPKKQIVILD